METKSCGKSRRKPISAQGTGQGERRSGPLEQRAQRTRSEPSLAVNSHHPKQTGAGFPDTAAVFGCSHRVPGCFPSAGCAGPVPWHRESSMCTDRHQLGDKALDCAHPIGSHVERTHFATGTLFQWSDLDDRYQHCSRYGKDPDCSGS